MGLAGFYPLMAAVVGLSFVALAGCEVSVGETGLEERTEAEITTLVDSRGETVYGP